MGSGIKGFKSQKILKSKINGYSFDDSVDPERYATIQELTGDKHGLDVVNHGAFKVNLAAKTVEAGSNVRVIKSTAHGAIKGDQIRFITDGIEASVLSIPDANTIILGSELNFDPTGLTFNILRHITPTYNSDGTINASSGPLQIKVNGLATDVNVDTITPSNTVRLPVELYSAAGPINITAGDINVQLSDTGATPDITRIGNGINRLDINAKKEALVHDDDVFTRMSDGTQSTKITDGVGTVTTKQLGTAVTNTDVGLVTNTVIHGLSSGGGGAFVGVKVTPSGALTTESTLAASVGTRIGTVAIDQTTDGTTNAVNIKSLAAGLKGRQADASSLSVALSTENAALVGALTETAPTTDTASSGLNGRLQRIAQRLTSLIALLPSSIGQKASTDSLSVVVANDQIVKSQEISANGTDPFSTKLITYNAQSVSGLANYFSKVVTSIVHGWDSTNSVHKEISVSSTGQVNTASTQQTVAGTITNAQVTVGLTAVRATVSGSAPNAARKKLMIKPSASNTGKIFLGASSVTTANGLEIIGPDRLEFEFDSGDYYLISDTAAQVVEIIEKA